MHGLACKPREELGSLRQRRWTSAHFHEVSVDLHLHPDTSIAAIMHEVIHESCMASDRDTSMSRSQVSLCSDGILLVAQVVADVGQQFYQNDTKVSRVALFPLRQQYRHAIEHQLAQARVVLGQVIDLWFRTGLRRAYLLIQAIKVVRAIDLEREVNSREQRVKVIRLPQIFGIAYETQRVDREIARRIDRSEEHTSELQSHSDL